MVNPLNKISEHAKLTILKWSYLVIVVAASITLVVMVKQNQNLVNDIQQDRKQVAYDLCLDQNSRHDELINFVIETNKDRAEKTGKPVPPVDPVARKFINLLASKRDCRLLIVNVYGSPIDESS